MKTQRAANPVGRPFRERPEALRWQWIEGHTSRPLPDPLTGRVRVPNDPDSCKNCLND
jgi:hypothetical protein